MSEHVFTIHVKPAEDLPGQWVGHCLELDVVSQGNDLGHALEMTAEASAMVLCSDMEQGRDPFDRGPVEAWTGAKGIRGPEAELQSLLAQAVVCEDAGEFVMSLIEKAVEVGLSKDGRALNEAGEKALA